MSAWRVAIAGMLALAVAMGIGRFAFTPLLPIMLADGVIDLSGASWLASANYLGYMVGALLCTFQPWLWRQAGWSPSVNGPVLVRTGLAATVVLTAAMALQWPGAWPALRFIAGVASALVFVYTSGFCLGHLARMQVPGMGALIYTGPGGGIVVSGLLASAVVALDGSARVGWLIFAVLALAMTACIWQVFHPRDGVVPPVPVTPSAGGESSAAQYHGATEVGLLTVAYGLAGFGYIITATFLPVIARAALPGSGWLDLFWPIFGIGVILGAIVASRVRGGDKRFLLAVCYAVQALGVAASLVSPTLAGFAAGSFLLGLPFTAITFFAMQEIRRIRPAQAASFMGLLTAMYGLGQIAGPPMTAALLARSRSPSEGFTLSLEIAALSLAAGSLLYGAMMRLYPAGAPGR